MTRRDAKIAARRIARLPWIEDVYLRRPISPRVRPYMAKPWDGYSVTAYTRTGRRLYVTSHRLTGRSRAALLRALGCRL